MSMLEWPLSLKFGWAEQDTYICISCARQLKLAVPQANFDDLEAIACNSCPCPSPLFHLFSLALSLALSLNGNIWMSSDRMIETVLSTCTLCLFWGDKSRHQPNITEDIHINIIA